MKMTQILRIGMVNIIMRWMNMAIEIVEKKVACCMCKTNAPPLDMFSHDEKLFCGGCLATTLSPFKSASMVGLQNKQFRELCNNIGADK